MTFEYSEAMEAKQSVISEDKVAAAFQNEAFSEMMARPVKADSMTNGRYPEQDAAIQHHHHGHPSPYPLPRFEPPTSRIDVSPPGQVRR